MNIRRLKTFSLAAIIATVGFVACRDQFSEEDFLKLQSDLAIQKDSVELLAAFRVAGAESQAQAESYIAALNQAGDLMAVSILVREDNKPVEGVSVSINTVAAPVTTDANGIAYFDRVRIGEATIRIAKADYTTASALVSFGTPGQPVEQAVTGNGITSKRFVAPAKRFENIGLPIFALAGNAGSTATITGRIVYERDLTNDEPEPLANRTVYLNLRQALAALITPGGLNPGPNAPVSNNDGQATVISYQLVDGSLGQATTNANGEYTMRVPANGAGIANYSLFIPDFIENQTAVVAAFDDGIGGTDVLPNGPERRNDIRTRWAYDPSVQFNQSSTITVPTVKVTVPEVPVSGRGYNPAFARVARPIDLGQYCDGVSNQEEIGNTVIRITNRGAGYSGVPTVTINGSEVEAALRGYITEVEVNDGGDYGSEGTNVWIQIRQTLDGGGSTTITDLIRVPVTLVEDGALPEIVLPLPVAQGFVSSDLITTDQDMNGLTFRVMNAASGGSEIAAVGGNSADIDITAALELAYIEITEAGTYSESDEIEIEITDGNPTTAATASVVEYRVQWSSSLLSQQAATTPYKVLPDGFNIFWPATAASASTTENNAEVFTVSNIGQVSSTSASIESRLTVDATGPNGTGINIIPLPAYTGLTFRTSKYWDAAPQLIVVDRIRTRSAADITISSDGKISNIEFSPVGSGYDEATVQQFALESVYPNAPGSGAVVRFSPTVDASGKHVTDISAIVVDGGSGYRENANRGSQGIATLGAGFPALVKTGQTYTFNLTLGTGIRITQVDGL